MSDTHRTVEVVTIGDELLRGDTVNSNAAWLGRELTERGVEIDRVTVVSDAIEPIATVVNEARSRADAVITTGGLGPTHDDRTMAAIAHARGVDLVEHAAARAWIERETEADIEQLAPGTLELPAGCAFIPNDVGLAPGAIIDDIYVLPGVPDEMEAMFGRIAEAFAGPPMHEALIEVAQPERAIAATLASIEDDFDVLVGSYPGETVHVRVLGRDEAAVEAAAAAVRERI